MNCTKQYLKAIDPYRGTNEKKLLATAQSLLNYIKALNRAKPGSAAKPDDTVAKPEVQKRFVESGMDTIIGSPAEFKAMIMADRKKWAEVIKAAGMRAD